MFVEAPGELVPRINGPREVTTTCFSAYFRSRLHEQPSYTVAARRLLDEEIDDLDYPSFEVEVVPVTIEEVSNRLAIKLTDQAVKRRSGAGSVSQVLLLSDPTRVGVGIADRAQIVRKSRRELCDDRGISGSRRANGGRQLEDLARPHVLAPSCTKQINR